jgi:hypothetical protein
MYRFATLDRFVNIAIGNLEKRVAQILMLRALEKNENVFSEDKNNRNITETYKLLVSYR